MKTIVELDPEDIKCAVRHWLQSAGHEVIEVTISSPRPAFAVVRINPPKVKS